MSYLYQHINNYYLYVDKDMTIVIRSWMQLQLCRECYHVPATLVSAFGQVQQLRQMASWCLYNDHTGRWRTKRKMKCQIIFDEFFSLEAILVLQYWSVKQCVVNRCYGRLLGGKVKKCYLRTSYRKNSEQ